MPGRYQLPFGEGHLIVTSDQKVHMRVAKNGTPYSHANLIPEPSILSGNEIHRLGFGTAFRIICRLSDFKWSRPMSFERLRPENRRGFWRADEWSDVPCESTSVLDLEFRRLANLFEANQTRMPASHTAFM